MELSVAQREAVRDIEVICSQESDSRELRRQVAARLSRLLYSDASAFVTVDPWTMIATDSVTFDVPPDACKAGALNEYLVEDVHKVEALARSGAGVAILGSAPDELRQASPRLRTILPMLGARHEARAACTSGGQCWGAVLMFRAGGQPDFSAADAALLRAASAPLAAGLRRTACLPGAGLGVTVDSPGPGVLILGPGSETLAANDAAGQWLDELGPYPLGQAGELPSAVCQVAARVQARLGEAHRVGRERGDPASPPDFILDAHARLRARSGRWVTVHGSPLVPWQGGTAVVIEAAPASDIAEVLMLAFGLTRRERQVLQLVIAGTPSAAIAAALHISAGTVQDHLKSIFAKTGVRSRGQLVARLLGEHYLPLVAERPA